MASRDISETIIIGRLVRNVELKVTAANLSVATFSIACNDFYKKDNQIVEDVDFFDVVAFGNQADNCNKYLSKGDQVIIKGRMKQQTWQDQGTGQNRSKLQLRAETVQFLNKKQQEQAPNDPYGGQAF